MGRPQELQVFKLIQEDLQFRDESNGEPWRLTSQPRPQGGHPRARGNKIQPGCIQPTPQQQELNMNTTVTSLLQFPSKASTMIHI